MVVSMIILLWRYSSVISETNHFKDDPPSLEVYLKAVSKCVANPFM